MPGPELRRRASGEHPAGVEMFYSLYFCMTGLHALHMIIGLGIMTWLAIMAWRERRSTPTTTRRSKSPACTGTSSTSSGFSCSRCCTSSGGTIITGNDAIMSAGHVAPKSLYYRVFLALLVGTALTVAVAFVDLGALNNVVMLTIAVHQGDARHPLLHARALEHAG